MFIPRPRCRAVFAFAAVAALAPSDPNILWAGTGEADIFRSGQAGYGIYKSADAGKTWTRMGRADWYQD